MHRLMPEVKVDELFRLGDRQKVQEDGVHDAEDRGVCTDSQSDRKDRDERENGAFLKLPKGKAKILRDSKHRDTSQRRTWFWARGAIRIPRTLDRAVRIYTNLPVGGRKSRGCSVRIHGVAVRKRTSWPWVIFRSASNAKGCYHPPLTAVVAPAYAYIPRRLT